MKSIQESHPSIDIEVIKEALDKRGYRLDEIVGYGAFACVFKVFSYQYNQYFAAKVCYVGISMMTKNIQSYTAEINALSKLYHPAIINVFSYFNDGDYLFLILDYCSKGSLREYVKNTSKPDYSLIFSWMRQAIEGLVACHSMGIAHRDIKPTNILIDQYNRIKIADFGLSLNSEHGKYISRFAGSLPFTSPEMNSCPKYDPLKADVWALGITFYYLLYGRSPYKASTETELKKQITEAQVVIPATVDKRFTIILGMMLNPNPEERSSAADILKVFNTIRVNKRANFANVIETRKQNQRFKSQVVESQLLARKIPSGHRRNSTVIQRN